MTTKGRKLGRFGTLLYSFFLFHRFISSCYSLNDEVFSDLVQKSGKALLKFRERLVSDPYGALRGWRDEELVADPCSWFGVECSDEGRVVILDLRDLCLGGTLAPEIGNLVHMKAILLRNNSFTGIIPEEIGKLKELELLDLGNNNFIGSLPSGLSSHLSFLDAASTQHTFQKPRRQLVGTNSQIMQLPTTTKTRLLRPLPAAPPPPCTNVHHIPGPCV